MFLKFTKRWQTNNWLNNPDPDPVRTEIRPVAYSVPIAYLNQCELIINNNPYAWIMINVINETSAQSQMSGIVVIIFLLHPCCAASINEFNYFTSVPVKQYWFLSEFFTKPHGSFCGKITNIGALTYYSYMAYKIYSSPPLPTGGSIQLLQICVKCI